MPCEDDEGSKKEISDMDVEALPLEEGDKKASREKTMGSLMDAVP